MFLARLFSVYYLLFILNETQRTLFIETNRNGNRNVQTGRTGTKCGKNQTQILSIGCIWYIRNIYKVACIERIRERVNVKRKIQVCCVAVASELCWLCVL